MKETRIKAHIYFPIDQEHMPTNFYLNATRSFTYELEILETEDRPEDGEHAMLVFLYVAGQRLLNDQEAMEFLEGLLPRSGKGKDVIPYQIYDVDDNDTEMHAETQAVRQIMLDKCSLVRSIHNAQWYLKVLENGRQTLLNKSLMESLRKQLEDWEVELNAMTA